MKNLIAVKGLRVVVKSTNAVATIDDVFDNLITYVYDNPLSNGVDGGGMPAHGFSGFSGEVVIHPKDINPNHPIEEKEIDEFAIGFANWLIKLTPSQKTSVWSKDGQYKGLFTMDNEQLLSKYKRTLSDSNDSLTNFHISD